jgi:hypothetical protein
MTVEIVGPAEPEEIAAVLVAILGRPPVPVESWRERRLAALKGSAKHYE